MKIEVIQPRLYEEFSQILKQERLSHAYLFSGGFGAFEMAIWLTQGLFCENPTDARPCGNCRACRLIVADEYSDLHHVKPDGQTIKAEQIRALTRVFSESGFESAKQVVIISQAEKMNATAANSLLKSIEEPESDVTVFLLTENDNLILPTIKSRAQVVSFMRNSSYLQNYLEQNGILKTQAEALSQISDSVNEALAIAQASWFATAFAQLQKFVKLAGEDKSTAFLEIGSLVESFDDKNKQKLAFELLLYLFNQARQVKLIENTFEAEKYWQANVRFESSLDRILL